MPAINNNRRKLLCMSQPLSMLYVAKIAFAQSKHFPLEHNIPIRETKIHWNKQHFGLLHYQVLQAKQLQRKLVSGFSFTCNKYPPQFTSDKSNDSSMREGIPLDALNWFERRYELRTPKSVGREGSKAWALSVVPHFSLSPGRLAFLTWGDFHTCSHFARSSIPEEKWGLLVVYSNWSHLDRVDQIGLRENNNTFQESWL